MVRPTAGRGAPAGSPPGSGRGGPKACARTRETTKAREAYGGYGSYGPHGSYRTGGAYGTGGAGRCAGRAAGQAPGWAGYRRSRAIRWAIRRDSVANSLSMPLAGLA
ncbi:hypothetical protein GCM10023324_67300 [Streptomyces youssoufiensis]